MTIDILTAIACTAAVTAFLCNWKAAQLVIQVLCVIATAALLIL